MIVTDYEKTHLPEHEFAYGLHLHEDGVLTKVLEAENRLRRMKALGKGVETRASLYFQAPLREQRYRNKKYLL